MNHNKIIIIKKDYRSLIWGGENKHLNNYFNNNIKNDIFL